MSAGKEKTNSISIKRVDTKKNTIFFNGTVDTVKARHIASYLMKRGFQTGDSSVPYEEYLDLEVIYDGTDINPMPGHVLIDVETAAKKKADVKAAKIQKRLDKLAWLDAFYMGSPFNPKDHDSCKVCGGSAYTTGYVDKKVFYKTASGEIKQDIETKQVRIPCSDPKCFESLVANEVTFLNDVEAFRPLGKKHKDTMDLMASCYNEKIVGTSMLCAIAKPDSLKKLAKYLFFVAHTNSNTWDYKNLILVTSEVLSPNGKQVSEYLSSNYLVLHMPNPAFSPGSLTVLQSIVSLREANNTSNNTKKTFILFNGPENKNYDELQKVMPIADF